MTAVFDWADFSGMHTRRILFGASSSLFLENVSISARQLRNASARTSMLTLRNPCSTTVKNRLISWALRRISLLRMFTTTHQIRYQLELRRPRNSSILSAYLKKFSYLAIFRINLVLFSYSPTRTALVIGQSSWFSYSESIRCGINAVNASIAEF